mmetsp:Transcript_10552/g.41181  ORF Transcript_10552/g.41181 Transcript_10552/m.41181 type:complete len:430 (-) Transcript_10552:885-2174(-)
MHGHQTRDELVVGTAHCAALVLLVVVVARVRALDADAESTVLAPAASPQLASRGDEEGVVATRGERRHRLVEIVEVLHEAGPRDARFPTGGGGERDVAEAELPVAARAPRPDASAVRQAHGVAAARHRLGHVHAAQRLEPLQRTGVVEVPVTELAVATAAARPQPAALADHDGMVRAGRDLRHLDAGHRVHPARDVNLDGGPTPVAQLATRREAPRHERAVGVERRAVRRAAGHALDGGGVRDLSFGAKRHGRGSRGVVVAALAELTVEASAEGVHGAAAGLRFLGSLPSDGGGGGGDDLAVVGPQRVVLGGLAGNPSHRRERVHTFERVTLAHRLGVGRDAHAELVPSLGERRVHRLRRGSGILILGQRRHRARHLPVGVAEEADARVTPPVLRRGGVHLERGNVRDVPAVAERSRVGSLGRHSASGG